MKSYENVRVVDDVSFQVERGAFFTLLGPSGSGKTTILKIIAGFVPQDGGSVYADDRDLSFEPPYTRRIGMVFQNYALFPHMTVAQNVGFPLRMRKVPRAEAAHRIAKALEIVQLRGFESRYPRQLSGGQQQRVALARTLVFNPAVVLMDEPLGALDKKLREHMQLEIKEIQRRLGITVVYVTHDQEEALTLSDQIGVMTHGRLEQVGNSSDLYHRPRSLFVADFIGESNFLPGRVVGRDGQYVTFETDRGTKVRAVPSIPFRQADKGVLFIRPEKVELTTELADGLNTWRGRVHDAVFVGESSRYQIELANGDHLLVKQMNSPRVLALSPGIEITVAFPPEDALIFLHDKTGEAI